MKPAWRCSLAAPALLAALVGPAVAQEAPAIDLAWTTRAIAEPRTLREGSVFGSGLALTGFGQDRARIEQEARGKLGPFNLLATATASGQEKTRPDSRLVVHEAYLDTTLAGERFSAGRKILSGDVGYAFRPLDVLQRESRLQLAPPPLTGIPMIAWDNFGADSAWSLIVANPGHGPGNAGSTSQARDDSSLALRLFRRVPQGDFLWGVASADFHGVARASARNGLELGAGFAVVPDEAIEIHGSLLSQQRGERRVPLASGATVAQLLNADRALQVERHGRIGKALLGTTWTAESGISAMGEVWWDGAASTADEWRRLAANAAARNALRGTPGVPELAIAGANAASTRLFEQGNLARRGLLARLAWSEPGGKWSVAADALASLEDGGRSLTLSAAYTADTWKLEAGLRRNGGKAESAFGLLPEKRAAFVTLSVSY